MLVKKKKETKDFINEFGQKVSFSEKGEQTITGKPPVSTARPVVSTAQTQAELDKATAKKRTKEIYGTEEPADIDIIKRLYALQTGEATPEQALAPEQTLAQQQALAQQQIQLGQLGQLTPEQKNRQVIQGEGAVGAAGVVGAGLGGASLVGKAGAGLGTAVLGPGLGTAIGTAGGVVIGFVGGAAIKIGVSQRQDVKQAKVVYTSAIANMDWAINNANAKKISGSEAISFWNEQLANFYSAKESLKEMTDSDLDRFLSEGKDEYSDLLAFEERLPQMQLEYFTALYQPDPTRIHVSQSTNTE